MMDMDERWSLVAEGEAILNKKAVYEPTKGQRFRQVICSRGWAICILMAIGIFMVAIAVIAAFARPGVVFSSPECEDKGIAKAEQSTVPGKQKAPQTYISTNGDPFPWKKMRLPQTVVPELYNIFIHPNISESYFKGKVLMTLRIVKNTNFIVFHTAELNISNVKVFEGLKSKDDPNNAQKVTSGQQLTVIAQLEYPRNGQFYVKTANELQKDIYVKLQVEFRGSFGDLSRLEGFYKSEYEVNGEKRYMVSTHFEATSARSAFPCMDEPQLKANFSLSIVRDPNHITLFNTELERSSPFESSLVLDEYETSVKMSTYLVAFVVCDFKNITKITNGGVQVRVFAAEDKIYMGNYALDAAVKILDYYNSFFGVPYPLPKQDLIAIPNFGAGAMENWGLITYRESAILFDPKKSTTGSKSWVATVVAHELAHQWFGNLVTMKWWNDLWLNEGFAAFVENIGADVVDKDFHKLDSFTGSIRNAMYLDSLSSSHPVEVEVHDPAEISSVFDSISYKKGGGLICMLQSVLGVDRFKAGLTSYLKKHAYSNAETRDLWESMQETSTLPSDLSVPEVMDTWTKQMGVPVVTITRDKGKLHFYQERFLLKADSKKEKSPYDYKWVIPFTFTTSASSGKQTLVWMNKGSGSADLPSGQATWVKGNVKSNGYYRVNYDKQGWQALIKQLTEDHTVFSVSDRIGIIDDVFSLARAGIIDYTITLDLSRYLIHEKDYFVWSEALSHLYFVASRLKTAEEYDLLRSHMISLAKPLIDSLGWDDTGSHLTRQLRASMIDLAAFAEYKPVVDHARDLFKQWLKNESIEINNNLRGLVYSTGLKFSQKSDWDLVFERYLKAKVPSDRTTMMGALCSPLDVRILKILLEYSLDESKVKSQDFSTVLAHVSSNYNGLLLAWRFFRENYTILLKRFGAMAFTWSSVVKDVVIPFNTQFDYDEIVTFFKDKDLGSAKLPLSQALEVVQSHIEWQKFNMKVVKSWLKDNVKKTSGPR